MILARRLGGIMPHRVQFAVNFAALAGKSSRPKLIFQGRG
jgi:hypothetical protein